jgi:hypothetical protein
LPIRVHRIAILSAAGALALAGQATAAPVQCPSISVTRTPVPGHAHRTARPKATATAVRHRHAAARPRVHKAATKKADGPRPAVVASSALPVLAPILPPDTMPATTPILAPGVTPATPIIGYKLKRSVRMVACAPVPLVPTTQADLVAPPGGPGAETPLITTAFRTPPTPLDQLQTFPMSPTNPTTPACCDALPPPEGPPGAPPLTPVPEPATWAMLIVGFFGLGAQLRRAAGRNRATDGGSPRAG